MLATAHITNKHGLFNFILKVEPIYTPSNTSYAVPCNHISLPSPERYLDWFSYVRSHYGSCTSLGLACI